ncbi:tail assembly chaperone [Bacillus phage phiNIT1]|uniref:Tail assembly chaperone n=1 Tax=Bacillus phage phiNIT1 TaxID=207656 RepID=S6B650_9CAUD|nr:tail assembly chaperone [Bacillus phage phiNIT1]BAN59572.1 hypothetical protein [Bacillus phage phiNIT1]
MSEEFIPLEDFEQEKTPEQREVEERQKQKKAIDRIVRGVNDVFEKNYKYEDLGWDFTVKIKMPNAIERGRIHATATRYLGGLFDFSNEYHRIVYTTLATLEVCGIDVPEELKAENLYHLDVAYKIGEDFIEWTQTFRV